MRSTIRRRTVYIASVVSILALIGGFALAALGNFSTISSNQNVVSTTLGTTVWNPATDALSPSFLTSAATCISASTATFSGTSANTQNACIKVATAATETSVASGDFVEEFTFTLAVTTTTPTTCVSTTVCTDTFTVTFTTSTGNGGVAYTVDLTDPTTSGGNDILNVYLDFGASAPSSITAMDIVATGS
jgi:hypothetical protein